MIWYLNMQVRLSTFWISYGSDISEADKTKPGPLFTKQMDFLPQDLVKSRSCEIGCYNHHVALKFDRHLNSAAAEVPGKF